MLPKRLRLPINHLPSRARFIFRGHYFVIKAAFNNLKYNRLGVIVGRKAAPKATRRNKIKREVFNFFRTSPALLRTSEGKGVDLLVVIGSKVSQLDLGDERELTKELALFVSGFPLNKEKLKRIARK